LPVKRIAFELMTKGRIEGDRVKAIADNGSKLESAEFDTTEEVV